MEMAQKREEEICVHWATGTVPRKRSHRDVRLVPKPMGSGVLQRQFAKQPWFTLKTSIYGLLTTQPTFNEQILNQISYQFSKMNK